MSSDSAAPRPDPAPSFSYDDGTRLFEVREITRVDGSPVTTYSVGPEPRNPTFRFAHDKAKGLFILTWSDGTVEFRDRPARQLMVEPDPVTGEMRPVTRNGQPVFICLREGVGAPRNEGSTVDRLAPA